QLKHAYRVYPRLPPPRPARSRRRTKQQKRRCRKDHRKALRPAGLFAAQCALHRCLTTANHYRMPRGLSLIHCDTLPFGPVGSDRILGTERLLKRSLAARAQDRGSSSRSEEHTSELQSRFDLVCRLLLEK